MFVKVNTAGLYGMEGQPVTVEADVSQGMPAFEIVGLPDTAVKEAKERVRAAIKNCGYSFPARRFTINLAPASLRKAGPAFDLPIAVALLFATEQINGVPPSDTAFIGEVSLAGDLRPVSGILPLVMGLASHGIKQVIVPYENAREGALVENVSVFGAKTLYDVMQHLKGEARLPRAAENARQLLEEGRDGMPDFAEVKGQENAKRALEIAAAGGHNCLLVGPPGAGKTMLAQRLPSILPPMTPEEALAVTRIHSVAGLLNENTPLVTVRPFRAPHHSASTVGLTGGGQSVRPGEISLAHGGVLFLDELPEFRRDAMEILRQPLEDGQVTITRAAATYTYPSAFMLVAAMNPCRCGYYGDPTHRCRCSESSVRQYAGKISGPLLDRIDLKVHALPVSYKALQGGQAEPSAVIRARVIAARERQKRRTGREIHYENAKLAAAELEKYCILTKEAERMLRDAFTSMQLSMRAYSRIVKVARTIADLADAEKIESMHIAEAVRYHMESDRLS
ncbi:MAG: YifB family Mg chelatase-like AAA ATPase [Clostridia bacterium]|nr:YifB family Mg chelatase-like AAA ATPase [Clostridia bacterium]